MNPIIDPSFIYLLQLIESLHIFAICVIPFSLAYPLISGIMIAIDDFIGKDLVASLKKYQKISIIIAIIATLILIFVPSKETLIAMTAAKALTPDNLALVGNNLEEALNYIFSKIAEITGGNN